MSVSLYWQLLNTHLLCFCRPQALPSPPSAPSLPPWPSSGAPSSSNCQQIQPSSSGYAVQLLAKISLLTFHGEIVSCRQSFLSGESVHLHGRGPANVWVLKPPVVNTLSSITCWLLFGPVFCITGSRKHSRPNLDGPCVGFRGLNETELKSNRVDAKARRLMQSRIARSRECCRLHTLVNFEGGLLLPALQPPSSD